MKEITDQIFKSITTKVDLLKSPEQLRAIKLAGQELVGALKNGNKILIAGNGGSAADAQHFSAELVGRFVSERRGLPALALTTNSSVITAIANDFSYDDIFSRQLEALGQPGDIFFAISTSGNSGNLIKALDWSRQNNLFTIGLTGKGGGKMKGLCDLSIIVPSNETQNIQEAHILIIHILCGIIDEAFSNNK